MHRQRVVSMIPPLEQAMSPKTKSVSVAILTTSERDGWINPYLAVRLHELGAHNHYRIELGFVLDRRPVEAARNCAAATALKQGCDWLCMIDNDCCPPPDYLSVLDEADDCRADIICLPTWCLGLPERQPRLNVSALSAKPLHEGVGLQEIAWGGFGTVFIRTAIFGRLPKPWFRTVQIPSVDPSQDYAQTYQGEDFTFCSDARAAGFRVFTDLEKPIDHFKTYDFEFARHLILGGRAGEGRTCIRNNRVRE